MYSRTVIPIYRYGLHLSVDKTIKKAWLGIKSPFFADIEPESDCKAYYLFNKDSGDFALLFKNLNNHPSHADIAHEIWHVTGRLMDDIGANPQWGEEEAAYLCDWITGWVYKKLELGGIKVSTKDSNRLLDKKLEKKFS